MATTLRLPFLLAFVVLSIPPWPAASPAELGVITDHLARPPSAEQMPHWLPAMDASLINRRREEGIVPDAVVSMDGKGNYTTIGAAIAAAPVRNTRRYVIHVKAGLYKEYLNVTSDMWNLMLLGDGMEETIISGDHSDGTGYGTMYSGTVSECYFISLCSS
jgi:pectinesterase